MANHKRTRSVTDRVDPPGASDRFGETEAARRAGRIEQAVLFIWIFAACGLLGFCLYTFAAEARDRLQAVLIVRQ
jgi:hypothetical protein